MKILKSEVPVDDQWHAIEIGDGVVHVGHQKEGFVTVWFICHEQLRTRFGNYRVYGTGHDIGPTSGADASVFYPKHVATVQAPSGLVWHLVTL